MKFGVSYNVFDGVELLEDSINSIYDHVDYVSVVAQKESYWGEKLTAKEINVLVDLKSRGYIDELVWYDIKKTKIAIHVHQITKRNIGLEISKKNGCSHHMTLDCDEFYTQEDLNLIIDFHKNNPDMVSYFSLDAYYKDPKFKISSDGYMDNDLFVSGFVPIEHRYVLNYPIKLKVDPTRKPSTTNWNVIDGVKMHHMSYIRADIGKKINNAASRLRYGNNAKNFSYYIDLYNKFKNEDDLAICADGTQYKIKEIEPLFKLEAFKNFINKK